MQLSREVAPPTALHRATIPAPPNHIHKRAVVAPHAVVDLAQRTPETHRLPSETRQRPQIVCRKVALEVTVAAHLLVGTRATQVVRVAEVQRPDPLEGCCAWQWAGQAVVNAVLVAGAQRTGPATCPLGLE